MIPVKQGFQLLLERMRQEIISGIIVLERSAFLNPSEEDWLSTWSGLSIVPSSTQSLGNGNILNDPSGEGTIFWRSSSLSWHNTSGSSQDITGIAISIRQVSGGSPSLIAMHALPSPVTVPDGGFFELQPEIGITICPDA